MVAAGICIGAGQDQRACAGFAQCADARNVGGKRKRVGEVRNDPAAIIDGGRDDRASEPAVAEIERAAGIDRGRAGRIDHAAVRNGERSDETATTAVIADGKRVRCVQHRAGACDGEPRGAVELIADRRESGGVNDAAVGNRK